MKAGESEAFSLHLSAEILEEPDTAFDIRALAQTLFDHRFGRAAFLRQVGRAAHLVEELPLIGPCVP